MRAILIDSTARTITEIETDGKLASLQAAVGGYIERVGLPNSDDLFVNEEGLLHSPREFFWWQGMRQPFAGNGIVIGHDGEGDSAGARIALADVKKKIRFMDLATVQQLIAMRQFR